MRSWVLILGLGIQLSMARGARAQMSPVAMQSMQAQQAQQNAQDTRMMRERSSREEAEEAARGPVPVAISVPAQMRWRVAEQDSQRIVAECRGPCSFTAVPGHYVVYAENDATHDSYELALRLHGPSRYAFKEGNGSAQAAGLLVGIAGSALFASGLVLALPSLTDSPCRDAAACDQQRKRGRIGLGLMIGGAIASPIGWVLFASNRTRLVREGYYGGQRAIAPRLALGVSGIGPGSLGLVAAGSF